MPALADVVAHVMCGTYWLSTCLLQQEQKWGVSGDMLSPEGGYQLGANGTIRTAAARSIFKARSPTGCIVRARHARPGSPDPRVFRPAMQGRRKIGLVGPDPGSRRRVLDGVPPKNSLVTEEG
jgi:hypothetical protein